MAIITISRGTYGGGKQLAVLLGERLGYRTVSRELLYERARDVYGVTKAQLQEVTDRTPSMVDPKAKRRATWMLTCVQASLCELLAEDDVVYHGRAGHLFFTGISHVLRVRFIAPRPVRIKMAQERERITEFEASRKIDQVDAERLRWTRFFYGVDWGDPALYDIVLNLEDLTVEDAADTLACLARLPSFQATEESRRLLHNLCLTSKVKAHLGGDPELAGVDLEISADDGRVRVAGILAEKYLARITQIVEALPGVKKLEAVSPTS